MKRKISRMLAWVLCVMLLLGSVPADRAALAIASDGVGVDDYTEMAVTGKDLSPMITGTTVKVLVNGQWQEVPQIKNGDNVQVILNFTIPADQVEPSFSYQLPSLIRVQKAQSGRVYKGDNEEIGVYTIDTNGKIVITYSDSFLASNGEAIQGNVKLEGWAFNDGDEGQTENFGGSGGSITVIPDKPPEEEKHDLRVEKSNNIGMAGAPDTRVIKYTVKVSTTEGSLNPVTVTDTLGSGGDFGSYDQNSFLIVWTAADGAVSAVTPGQGDLTFNDANSAFTLANLPTLGKGESYTITYDVKLKDSFINMVNTGNGYYTRDNSVQANNGKDWPSTNSQFRLHHTVLTKSGSYNQNTGKITWTIDVNPSGWDITGAVLSDGTMTLAGTTVTLPTTVNIRDDSGNTGTITLPYTFTADSPWNKKHCVITFDVPVDPVFGNNTASNTATLQWNGTGFGSTGSVGVGRVDLQEKHFYSDNAGTTAGTRLFTWQTTVKIPANGLPAGSDVTDTLGNHQTFVAPYIQSVVGWKGTVNSALDANAYTVTTLASNSFRLTFNSDIAASTYDKVVITYVSTVDTSWMETNQSQYFDNVSVLKIGDQRESDWDQHRYTNGVQLTKQGGVPVRSNNGSINYTNWTSGSVSVDYDNAGGYLRYRLIINTDLSMQGDFTVTDVFPKGTFMTQQYGGAATQCSLKVWYYDLNTDWLNSKQLGAAGNPVLDLTKDASYWDKDTMTLNFHSGYEGHSIGIEYVLMIDPALWADLKTDDVAYTNTASIGDHTVTETQNVHRKTPVVDKEAMVNAEDGHIVNYRITLNPAGKDLLAGDTLTLVDQLDTSKLNAYVTTLTLLSDSVVMRHYDPAAKDHLGAVMDKGDYTVNYNQATQTLTVTLPDATPAVLDYAYYFVANAAAGENGTGKLTFLNSCELNGVSEGSGSNESKIDAASSSASSWKGALTVNKVDKDHVEVRLNGATFDLLRYENSQWTTVRSYTTATKNGVDGIFTVDMVTDNIAPLTLFKLVETAAPTGYAELVAPVYFVRSQDGTTLQATVDAIKSVLDALGLTQDDVILLGYADPTITLSDESDTLTIRKQWVNESGAAISTQQSATVNVYYQANAVQYDTLTVISHLLNGDGTQNSNYGTNGTKTVTQRVKPGSSATIAVFGWDGSADITIRRADGEQSLGTVNIHQSYDVQVSGDTTVEMLLHAWPANDCPRITSYVKPVDRGVVGDKIYLARNVVLSAPDYTATFDDIDLYADDGSPYAYFVEEVSIPAGWEPHYINQGAASGTITVKNVLVNGSLRLSKQSVGGVPLAGAAFALYAMGSDGQPTGNAIATGQTGSDGLLVMDDLPLGTYLLRETAAPEGYFLPDGLWKVIIGKDASTIEGTDDLTQALTKDAAGVIVNYNKTPELPDTGGMGTRQFVCLGLGLMLLACLILTRTRKRRGEA